MFFLFILIIIFLFMAIYTSRIGIEVQNLQIDTQKIKKINEESRIYVYLIIFKKIKLFKKDIKKIKMFNKGLDMKILKNTELKIKYKDLLKSRKIGIEKFDLNMQLGTENAALTAMLVGIISILLGVTIRKPKYEVIPIYSNQNLLKIKFDGIFIINLMHYIYVYLKWRYGYERTSNRKSYDNCYE